MTQETKPLFAEGLEGVIAAESSICIIDGKNSKLAYRGYDIHELTAQSTYEETSYLLLFSKLPNRRELQAFRQELAAERSLPEPLVRTMSHFPKNIHPMAALRTAASLLGLYDPEAEDKSIEANIRKAKRLIAKVPLIVATFERQRKGQPLVAPKTDPSVGDAANFLYMLKGRDASALEARTLDKYFILLTEHDLNASTFAARIAASTTSDMYSAIVSAIGTLKGDLHGSANSRAMESLLEIGEIQNVENYVNEALAKKRKLMGFGHRVYKGPDPRAMDLHEMARELALSNAGQAKWFAISEKLEKIVFERKGLYCNVDFYSASVLYTLEIPVDLFTPMFAVSRMAGYTAHVLEQYRNNRLMRPVSIYTGEGLRAYVPIDNRP